MTRRRRDLGCSSSSSSSSSPLPCSVSSSEETDPTCTSSLSTLSSSLLSTTAFPLPFLPRLPRFVARALSSSMLSVPLASASASLSTMNPSSLSSDLESSERASSSTYPFARGNPSPSNESCEATEDPSLRFHSLPLIHPLAFELERKRERTYHPSHSPERSFTSQLHVPQRRTPPSSLSLIVTACRSLL